MIQIAVRKLGRFLLDFFLPKYCLHCFTIGDYICINCLKKELKFFWQECAVCRKKVKRNYYIHDICNDQSSLDGVFVLFRYNDFVKKLIGEYKYNGFFSVSETLIELLLSYGQIPDVDIITSVPLHNYRKRSRGFNQSELLAKGIAEASEKDYVEMLVRVKNTKSQMKLSKAKRLTNLKDAFDVINPKLVRGKNILILDDVITTGTTLEECANILKDNGVKKIFCLVISRR